MILSSCKENRNIIGINSSTDYFQCWHVTDSGIRQPTAKSPKEVCGMKREELKLFTKTSFYTAVAVIFVMPLSFVLPFKGVAIFIFLASVFAMPLSIISIFSRESLAIRIFSLIVNFAPSTLIGYGLLMELIDEFLRSPP